MVLEFTNQTELDKPKEEKMPEKSLIQVTELPSGFLPYPKGSKIYYAPLTLGELENLNSGTLNLGQALDNLINSIYVDKFDKLDLAYFDLVYIGVQRKLTALGDVRGTINGFCTACENKNEKEFTYTELEFEELKVSALPIRYEYEEPKFLEFSLMTYRNWKKMGDLPEHEIDRLTALSHMVSNYEPSKAKEILSKLSGDSINYINRIESLLDYGIKPFKLVCAHVEQEESEEVNGETGSLEKVIKPITCGHEFMVEVTNPFDYTFRPGRPNNLNESKIRFGRS